MGEFGYGSAFGSKQGIDFFERSKVFRRRFYVFWGFPFLGAGIVFHVRSSAGSGQTIAIVAATLVLIFGIFEIYYWLSKRKSIKVDFENEYIELRRFRYSLKFWDIGIKKMVVIPFDEILYAERTYSKIEHAYVYTKDGQFSIYETMERFDDLFTLLNGIGTAEAKEIDEKKQFVRRSKWSMYSYGAGAGIVFLFVLWFFLL